HKRMRGMFSQRRIKAQLFFFKSVKLILIAIAAAALLVMLIAPEVPPAVKSEEFPPQINLNLETLTESRQPQTMQFSEEGVNAYLASALKRKKEKLNHPLISFERALVAFTEGNCRVTIERSIFGYSIFTSGDYAVQIEGGKVTASPKSGAIGRMPIHPSVMQYAGFLFSDGVGIARIPGALPQAEMNTAPLALNRWQAARGDRFIALSCLDTAPRVHKHPPPCSRRCPWPV